MPEHKYESQIRNLRKNYTRFPLDLRPDVLEAFKQVCSTNNTTPTTEIKKFINRYCAEYGSAVPGVTVEKEVEVSPELLKEAETQGIKLDSILVDALTNMFEKEGGQ